MSEVDWEAIRIEAEIVFGLVASLNNNKDDEVMHKDELIKAHHGDFHLFDELDFDSDGRVTSEEWHAFLKRNHAEKAHKGDEWLRSMFHTLRQNIEQDGNSQSDKAEGPQKKMAAEESMEVRPASEIKQEWDARMMRGLMDSLAGVNPRLLCVAAYLGDKRGMFAEADEVEKCVKLTQDKVSLAGTLSPPRHIRPWMDP